MTDLSDFPAPAARGDDVPSFDGDDSDPAPARGSGAWRSWVRPLVIASVITALSLAIVVFFLVNAASAGVEPSCGGG